MPRRADVTCKTWLGEEPRLGDLVDQVERRKAEDLAVHAHVRALHLCSKLWTTPELRDYLELTPRTWRRLLAADAGLRALRIELPQEGGKPLVRWPAGAVVAHYLSRPKRRGKDDR